jgi:hypothetical protein
VGSFAFDLRFGERGHGRERRAHTIVEFRCRRIGEPRDRYDSSRAWRWRRYGASVILQATRLDEMGSEAAQAEGGETHQEAERREFGDGSAKGRPGVERLQDGSGLHWNHAAAEGCDDRDPDERAEGTRKPRSRCCFHDRLIAVFVPSSARRHRRLGLRRLYGTWM